MQGLPLTHRVKPYAGRCLPGHFFSQPYLRSPASSLRMKFVARRFLTMRLLTAIFALGFAAALAVAPAFAQAPKPALGEHTTIRHRKVADEASPSDQATEKAEAALEKLDAAGKPDYATAEPLLKQAVTLDATNFRAWYDLGYLHDASGRTDDAIAAYRKAVALKPNVFEAQLHLGLALASKNDATSSADARNDAEKFLSAATQLKPESKPEQNLARAWIALGRVQESHDPAAALASYDHATEADPKQVGSQLLGAALAERQKDALGAEQRYRAALKSAPDAAASADALIGLANLYMRSQRLPQAEAVLRQFIATHPDQAAAHIQLARVLASTAEATSAAPPAPPIAFGSPASKAAATDPAARAILARKDEAATEYETGIYLGGADAASVLELGSLYIAAGKLSEAEALYRQQLQATPRDPELHHLLGIVVLKQKRFADAQAELLAAAQLDPKSGPVWGDLASAAAENMQYELALKAMDERARYLPDLPIGYFLRATCLDHLHLRKEAVEAYRHFLQTAQGQYPDQEWAARHRIITLEPKK